MKGKGYKWAVAWIADNDDVDLGTPELSYVLTVYLVADMFGKDPDTVAKDVNARREKINK